MLIRHTTEFIVSTTFKNDEDDQYSSPVFIEGAKDDISRAVKCFSVFEKYWKYIFRT